MQQRQFWSSEIKNERQTLRVLVWFIKAMLITHCCFSSKSSENRHECSIIEDLERYKIAASIDNAAVGLYNDYYRLRHRRAVITNEEDQSLSGKIVQIERFDSESGVYLTRLITDQSSLTPVDPGRLTSLSLSSIDVDQSRPNSRRREIVLQSTDDSTQSFTVHFDLGCFRSFYHCFDHSKLIQSEQVYQTFRHMTKTVEQARETRTTSDLSERESLMQTMSTLGHQEMIDSLLKNDPFGHMFNFPCRSNNEMLYNSGRRVGIFDHGSDPDFDITEFCLALHRRKSHPVDGTAFRSLLPMKSLNDGAMNVLMPWYVSVAWSRAIQLPFQTHTCSAGSLRLAMTSTCSIRTSFPNF